jgi:hypothetical protein
MSIKKESFFFYYLKKTGGLHDPRFVIEMIKLLKEWLPETTEDEDSWKEYNSNYYNGQGDYKQFLMDNLK